MGYHDYFWGTGRRILKMNITSFLWEMRHWTLFLNPNWLKKIKKPDLEHNFPLVLLGRLFLKPIGFNRRWTRTNRVNFMKIDSKLQPLSYVLLYTTSSLKKKDRVLYRKRTQRNVYQSSGMDRLSNSTLGV